MVELLDTDGQIRKWLGNVYYDGNKNEEGQLAEYFSLSEKDIEKFTPKKKKGKLSENSNSE